MVMNPTKGIESLHKILKNKIKKKNPTKGIESLGDGLLWRHLLQVGTQQRELKV